MTEGREIRFFDYVNHPYDRVRDALSADAPAVFHSATKAATSRAQSVASELRVNIGGIEIGTDIEITIHSIEEFERELTSPPETRLQIEWKATKNPRLFPLMKADLCIYPLTATETQLELLGHYEPPLGALGDALNAIVGHRIAEASVHRFMKDVTEYLRIELAKPH